MGDFDGLYDTQLGADIGALGPPSPFIIPGTVANAPLQGSVSGSLALEQQGYTQIWSSDPLNPLSGVSGSTTLSSAGTPIDIPTSLAPSSVASLTEAVLAGLIVWAITEVIL